MAKSWQPMALPAVVIAMIDCLSKSDQWLAIDSGNHVKQEWISMANNQ